MPGATTGKCRLHGGLSPSGRKSAHLALVREQIDAIGLSVDDHADPAEALLREVRRASAVVAWLDEQVGQLPDLWEETSFGRQLDARVVLWRAERRALADVAARAIGAGVVARFNRAEAARGEIAAQVVAAVLAALGHDTGSPEVQAIVMRSFDVIAGDG